MPKPANLPNPLRRDKGATKPVDRSAPSPHPPAAPERLPKTKGLTIKLDEVQYRRLRMLAATTGRTHQDLCEEAIIAMLDANNIQS